MERSQNRYQLLTRWDDKKIDAYGDDEWRRRNRTAFRSINAFHEAARQDLGIQGSVTGEQHPERDLLLRLPARRPPTTEHPQPGPGRRPVLNEPNRPLDTVGERADWVSRTAQSAGKAGGSVGEIWVMIMLVHAFADHVTPTQTDTCRTRTNKERALPPGKTPALFDLRLWG
jgi:hypothetical protein